MHWKYPICLDHRSLKCYIEKGSYISSHLENSPLKYYTEKEVTVAKKLLTLYCTVLLQLHDPNNTTTTTKFLLHTKCITTPDFQLQGSSTSLTTNCFVCNTVVRLFLLLVLPSKRIFQIRHCCLLLFFKIQPTKKVKCKQYPISCQSPCTHGTLGYYVEKNTLLTTPYRHRPLKLSPEIIHWKKVMLAKPTETILYSTTSVSL